MNGDDNEDAMDEDEGSAVGSILWHDLTVPDAALVRDFYSAVVGWTSSEVDMGGYTDFNMNNAETHETVAGICHARGVNAALPAQWLIYFGVEDLDRSLAQCREKGGAVLRPATAMGEMGRYAVIQDPAGAVCAIFEPAE